MLKAVRSLGTDLAAALTVLALVFLSFGSPPSTASTEPVAAQASEIAILSFCGGPLGEDHGVNGPCHACRVQIADLPPPPCESEPAYAGFAYVHYTLENEGTPANTPFERYAARAPPALVRP